MSDFTWTDERIAQLRELWAQGLSCTQVATRLNEGLHPDAPRATRNAVIGKISSLGLSGRIKTKAPDRPAKPKPPATPKLPKPLRQFYPKAKKVALDVAPAPKDKCFVAGDRQTVEIHNLRENQCHWPFDPRDEDSLVTYCGEPAAGRYCPAHEALSVATPPQRKRDNAGHKSQLQIRGGSF